MLAFVIPLRHPSASKNWVAVIGRLKETLRSVTACAKRGRAFGVLVVNRQAELPSVPEGITIVRVDHPPPSISVFRGEVDERERKKAVHLDKGRKVLIGALSARDLGAQYIMPVDADDLVSDRLPGFVTEHAGSPGWRVSRGWILPVGTRCAMMLRDFDQWCGTSMIVSADVLELERAPSEVSVDIVRRWFGHHRELIPGLVNRGHIIGDIPFPAAVYRTGHTESNYRRGTLGTDFFSLSNIRSEPVRTLKRLLRVRKFNNALVKEFHDGRPLE